MAGPTGASLPLKLASAEHFLQRCVAEKIGAGRSACDAARVTETGSRGRPRGLSERVRQDVHAAVRRLLLTDGYAAMRLEDVAAVAGVHKSTLYRQWATKAQLVRDVLVAGELEHYPRVDEGSLAADVEALVRGLTRLFRDPTTIAFVQTRATADDPASATSKVRARAYSPSTSRASPRALSTKLSSPRARSIWAKRQNDAPESASNGTATAQTSSTKRPCSVGPCDRVIMCKTCVSGTSLFPRRLN